jgi:DNA-binding beta-propeller fold protein YncE
VAAATLGGAGFLWAFASHPRQEGPPATATISQLGLKGLPFYGPGYSALDAQGQLFVMDADFSNRYIRILKLSSAGRLVSEQDFFRANVRPRSLTADEQGNLYVTMAGAASVYTFSSSGSLLMSWAVIGGSPVGIARTPEGTLYLTLPSANLIQKYTATGRLLAQWGTKGNSPGQFEQPTTLALDSQGNVYVTDSGNERIQKFAQDGHFISMWGTPGSSPGQFLSPGAITVDRQNNVYVTDGASGLVQKFSSTGALLDAWGKPGAAGVQFGIPRGVATDSGGNIYISSAELAGERFLHGRITKLAPDGAVLAVWT